MRRSSFCFPVIAALACSPVEPVPDIEYGCSDSQRSVVQCEPEPVPVATAVRFASITAGADHTCGLDAEGAAWCWGSNASGALGASTTATFFSAQPLRVNTGLRFASLTSGGRHTCGVTATREAFCWGSGQAIGEAGMDASCSSGPCRLDPAPAAPNLRFDHLRAGETHTCGIAGGGVFCWGMNILGETGSSIFLSAHADARAVTNTAGFTALDARFRFSCGLDSSARLFCWGWGEEGQLGNEQIPVCDGTFFPIRCSPAPVPAATSVPFIEIALGSAFGCGRTASGQAHCWGENGQGQLGRLAATRGVAPIESMETWSTLAAGYFHACAIRAFDSRAFCWGSNANGELGAGASEYAVASPGEVLGGHHFRSLTAGRDHTCGLDASGRAWCWGGNRFGQLGSDRG